MNRPTTLVTITTLTFLVTSGAVLGGTPFGVAVATKRSAELFSQNVLVWPDAGSGEHPIEDLIGYNLYRKIDPRARYPRRPIHTRPLRPLSQCSEIRRTLGRYWSVVEQGLTEPPPGQPAEPPVPFDPCELPHVPRGSVRFERLQILSRHSWRIATAIGQGYVDVNKPVGQRYYYELRAVTPHGEVVLQSDIGVETGHPATIPAPPDVRTHPEDQQILVTWGDREAAGGFFVYRADAPAGPYRRVHERPVLSRVRQDLFGNAPIVPDDPVDATRNGLIDFQRWDAQGDPIRHRAGGVWVHGPWNDTPYYYKVAGVDLLGQQGPLSEPVEGRAHDLTPPGQTSSVRAIAHDDTDELEVRWVKVTRDVDGHPEMPGVTTYRVYRFENSGNPYVPSSPDPRNPDIAGTLVAELPAPPRGQSVMSIRDDDPILSPAHGEQTFWYRVVCIDAAGNRSEPSAAAGGFLADETAPTPVLGTAGEGFDEHIRVTWDLSAEEDVDTYQVYRSLCDEGVWACERSVNDGDFSRCPNAWVLVGTVHHVDFAEEGDPAPFLDDATVPGGSPLCYAYLVKAVDESQNASGCWPPCPQATPPVLPGQTFDLYICQRLRDTRPPAPPVITALKARDGGIEVEWAGPPIQDIKAYYVYRAETRDDDYSFVGGYVVETQTAIDSELPVPPDVDCDRIPLKSNEELGTGSFLDMGANGAVEAKKIYWYRVLGVDQVGNISAVDEAAPVSTFTFTTARDAAPVITSVTPQADPCALVVEWTSALDSTRELGFAVYRSTSRDGSYKQMGGLVTGRRLVDRRIRKGVTYWYRAVRVATNGKRSASSAASDGRLP